MASKKIIILFAFGKIGLLLLGIHFIAFDLIFSYLYLCLYGLYSHYNPFGVARPLRGDFAAQNCITSP